MACVCVAVLAGEPLPALTPSAALKLASAHEARYLAAQANFRSETEVLEVARAGLLPEVGFTASRTHNALDASTGSGPTQGLSYWSGSVSVTMRQPLYRPESWSRFRQASVEVTRQEAILASERSRLALDVAGAYLEVLRLQADMNAQRAQLQVHLGQAAAAQRAVSLGQGSAADRDAKSARAELASLRLLEAQSRSDDALRQLQKMIGATIARMRGMADESFRVPRPALPPLDFWKARTQLRSPDLMAAKSAVAVAQEAVERVRAGELPVLDLVAGRSKSSSDSFTSINNTYYNTSIGLHLSVPIYAGGRYASARRQALAQLDRAQAQLDGVQRDLEVTVEREYRAVEDSHRRLRAHELVVNAAGQALAAMRQGVVQGQQSPLDVQEALAQLENARSERTVARLQFITAQLRLNGLAGEDQWLSLASLDDWLVEEISILPQ